MGISAELRDVLPGCANAYDARAILANPVLRRDRPIGQPTLSRGPHCKDIVRAKHRAGIPRSADAALAATLPT